MQRKRWRCNACAVEYDDHDPTGRRVFHQCAEIPNPAVRDEERDRVVDPPPTIRRAGHVDEREAWLDAGEALQTGAEPLKWGAVCPGAGRTEVLEEE